jgi:hypothetical protein
MIKRLLAGYLAFALGGALSTAALAVPAGTGAPSGPLVPFTGVGPGLFPASPARRATHDGAQLDARLDFGLACDGATNDTAKVTAMINQLNLTSGGFEVTFPGTCLVNWANFPTINQNFRFEGIHGGGLKVASGQTPNGVILTLAGNGQTHHFEHFTLDLGGNTASVYAGGIYASPGGALDFEDSAVVNGSLTTGGALYLIQCYGMTSAHIARNYFSLTAPSNQFNEGVNCGNQSFPSSNLDVTDNWLVNTGVGVFGVGDNHHIDRNRVNGWGYGAGITFEVVGWSDPVTKNVTVEDNKVENSMTSADASNTWLDGYEIGYNGVVVSGNTSYKTCGAGFTFYGKVSLLGNRAVDAGTCNHSDYYNSGFVASVPGQPSNVANGSYLEGNTVYDDGGGNTSYGYSDVGNVLNVGLGPNDFNGLKGATNIVGGSNFTTPQSGNLITNPCFYFDQRKNRTAFSAGFGPDQWGTYQSTGSEFFETVANNFGFCASSLHAVVSTSGSPASGELHGIVQDIPGAFAQELNWTSGGNQTPRDLVLSFQMKSSVTPLTQSVSIQNINATTDYVIPFTYTAAAGTLQTFSFRIPYDNYNQTAPNANFAITAPGLASLKVVFDTGSGTGSQTSTYRQWIGGNANAAASATPFVSEPNGSSLDYSSVRLVAAEADNGWQQRSYAEELGRVRLFYRSSFPQGVLPAQNAGSLSISSLTSSSTTATATVANTALIANGQTLTIAGATPSAYNGSYAVTVTSPTTFTYTFGGGTSPATGTLTATGATGGASCVGNPIANGEPSLTVPFETPMLKAPTIAIFNPDAANANWWDVTAGASVTASVPAAGVSANGFTIQAGATVSGIGDLLCAHYTADGGI